MINKQTQNTSSHISVMLDEAITALNIKPDGRYVDATFGRGGHSSAILERLSEKGRLLAFDKDPEAVAFANKKFGNDVRFICHHGSYADMDIIVPKHEMMPLDGILFDLGVSSPQLDNGERGFSHDKDGPLDMRMDNTQGITAEEWLDAISEDELIEVLKNFGEEKYSSRIAKAIIENRTNQKISCTSQLVKLIQDNLKYYQKNKNPATRTFQAIRIAVNNELSDLEKVLQNIIKLLEQKGRIVFISFQSLEHKIIKAFIKKNTAGNEDVDINSSVMTQRKSPQLKRIGREGVSSGERRENRRARSAWMRIVEKIS
ncbi:MAG: 16S rRNA (cytosine(1402)-N(4))-methyltransferase RsmH [Pseudomonadota bacterium]|nr:16S rRNA (cytosine(1402)-N(4))-methyltransferase RsmH [Pseudomonadota bacterium]